MAHLTPLIPSDDSLVLSQRLHLLIERQSQASGRTAARRETVRDRLNRWEEFDRNVDALMNKFSLLEDKMNKLDSPSIEDSIAAIRNVRSLRELVRLLLFLGAQSWIFLHPQI